MLWPVVGVALFVDALRLRKTLGAPTKGHPKRKGLKALDYGSPWNAKHSRKFFWFFLFTKRTVPARRQRKKRTFDRFINLKRV
jgi:hypothetical protein